MLREAAQLRRSETPAAHPRYLCDGCMIALRCQCVREMFLFLLGLGIYIGARRELEARRQPDLQILLSSTNAAERRDQVTLDYINT